MSHVFQTDSLLLSHWGSPRQTGFPILFQGYGISFWDEEKVLEVGDGDGYTAI